MDYNKGKDYIEIFGKNDFDIKQILECGQVFSYQENEDCFLVYSVDKKAKVTETDRGYIIKTDTPDYFENYFDLHTDYGAIKTKLSKYEILQKPIEFGSGIRILKQNLFETLISFIVSANNNIKRIQLILNRLREKLGKDMGTYHAFPTREELLSVDMKFFTEIGAGYRDKYLFNVVRQVDEKMLENWKSLPTNELRKKLIHFRELDQKLRIVCFCLVMEKEMFFLLIHGFRKCITNFMTILKIGRKSETTWQLSLEICPVMLSNICSISWEITKFLLFKNIQKEIAYCKFC